MGSSRGGQRDRRSPRPQSVDLDEDRRDVVLAAALVREVDEAPDGDVAAEPDDPGDVVVAQVSVKAVAAEQEARGGREGDASGVDLDVLAIADGARDDVPVGRPSGLLRGDEPLFELPGDERVVL